MKFGVIFQSIMLLSGLPLIMALLFLTSIEKADKLNSHTLVFISLAPGGFLLKILSIICLRKNLIIQSNYLKLFAQPIECASRVVFLCVAGYLILYAGDSILLGIIAIIFALFLFLQDYLQQKLCKDFKIQLFAEYNKFVVFGSILFESFSLLSILAYAINQSVLNNSATILFQISVALFILYGIPLRVGIVESQFKFKKKVLEHRTTNCDKKKACHLDLTARNHTLSVNQMIYSEINMGNEVNIEKSMEESQNQIFEKSQNQIIHKPREGLHEHSLGKPLEESESQFFEKSENESSISDKKNSILPHSGNFNKLPILRFNSIDSKNKLKARQSSVDRQTSTNPEQPDFLRFNSNQPSQHHSFISIETPKFKKSEPVKNLWEYLPTIFEEGIAIFENDQIVKSNLAFSKCIGAIINQDNLPQDLGLYWQEIFEKIQIINNDLKSSSSISQDPVSLKEELLKIINLSFENLQNEMQFKYVMHDNDQTFQFSIFKKLMVSSKIFTIIKIDNFSDEYKTFSRKATKKVKKKFRLSLAHEAKTPLNYLLSTIKLIKNETSSDGYNQLKNSAKIFQLVLNGIFKVAFIEDPKYIECLPEKFSILASLKKTLNSVEFLFKNRGIKLILKSDVENCENFIFHDKIIIETIVYQFLSNALKFTNNGEVLVQLYYNINNEEFEISVTDTGIGMTNEELDNMKTFLISNINTNMEISEHSTGANIGLNMCKSLLSRIHKFDDNKKRLSVTSTYGSGSTFIATISKQCPDERKSAPKSQSKTSMDKITLVKSMHSEIIVSEPSFDDAELQNIGSETKLPQFYSTIKNSSKPKFLGVLDDNPDINVCNCPYRILVVDDEEFNLISFRQICSLILKNTLEKYELLVGHNGEEGLSIFLSYFENKKCASQSCCPIKMVVLDYNMPKLTGPKAAAKMTAYLSYNLKKDGVKLYGWTAYVGAGYQDEFAKAGATNILSKPIKIKELSQVLSEFLKIQVV